MLEPNYPDIGLIMADLLRTNDELGMLKDVDEDDLIGICQLIMKICDTFEILMENSEYRS